MKQCILLILTYCTFSMGLAQAQAKRIITLSSALSETVHALGAGAKIVAVDVTSEYPQEILRKPRVSKDRAVSLEGLLSFKPDLILAAPAEISSAIESKLKRLGIKVVIIQQDFSVNGASRFIREVGAAIGATQLGIDLSNKVSRELTTTLANLKTGAKKPKVLFIYAQGVGLMSVAGRGSHIDAVIALAGGRNAVQEFNDFKPYSTESLIKADPDVLLLFDFGATSLGGKKTVLSMPGVSLTKAGKSSHVVVIEGPLLVNFATRLPRAIADLNKLLYP